VSTMLHHARLDVRTHRSWSSMMQRCYGVNNPNYPRYGGRGLFVCARWHVFEMFLKDMGTRPRGKSIERLDNDKGYEPSNCKWGTRIEQANNTSRSRRVTYKGKTMTVSQWARHLRVDPNMIYTRLFRGCPVEDVLRPAWSVRKERDHNSYAHGEAMGKAVKLTRCCVDFIRAVCAHGAKPKLVAPLFGVSHWNIYNILSGKSWR
jgi:hypothetical protein